MLCELVELLFVLYSIVELDNTSHSANHVVNILLVRYIESLGATLDLACEKGKVHPVGCDEKQGIIDTTDEGIELVELLACERGSFESNRVIRLRQWTPHWYVACLAFVDALNRMVEICDPVGGEHLCRRDNQSRNVLNSSRFVSVLDLPANFFK